MRLTTKQLSNMDQLDMFTTPKDPLKPVQIQNGSYIHVKQFFNSIEADTYLKACKDGIEWKQESMKMYGKVIPFPRLQAWYGDQGKFYSFSGIKLEPNTWNQVLIEIKTKIEPLVKVSFNSVLLNRYRDGSDSMSWHTDAEKELGKNPTIASVNLGATRSFQLKHNTTKEKIVIYLAHGDLLIMMGELQHFWKHQIPKTKKIIKERINLTFRVIK